MIAKVLIPSRKWEVRRASVFTGACCAGTYSMGQPVGSACEAHGGRASGSCQGTSSANRMGGIRILAQVRRHVETGPGHEARGGRRVTCRCFRWGGRPRGSTLAVAGGSHAFVRVAVRNIFIFNPSQELPVLFHIKSLNKQASQMFKDTLRAKTCFVPY